MWLNFLRLKIQNETKHATYQSTIDSLKIRTKIVLMFVVKFVCSTFAW